MVDNETTEELNARTRMCETPEDLHESVHEEGYELSDEVLQAISGGVNEKTHSYKR